MKTAAEHPYFIFDDLMRLREHAGEIPASELAGLKARIALNAPDPAAAAALANLSGDDWLSFYPADDRLRRPDTGSAIDTFLNTFGSHNAAETSLLERLIFNPTPDYATTLAMEEQANPTAPASAPAATEQDVLIKAFIETHPPEPVGQRQGNQGGQSGQSSQGSQSNQSNPIPSSAPAPAATKPAAPPQSSSLQETLAKTYIKQGRYQKAFDIISELNLNNPEKSAYFADQLRFLQKIIQIQQARQARKG